MLFGSQLFLERGAKINGTYRKKPLFISALPDHIDFCVDLTQLLEQTLELNRQVFLFTGDKRIRERVKNVFLF